MTTQTQSRPAYWQLLQDPRWQRRRLEIMERDGFACVNCESEDRTLNVHHKLYRSGAMPWEYEDDVLETLCGPCHKRRSEVEKYLKENTALCSGDELDAITAYAATVAAYSIHDLEKHLNCWSYGSAQGYADFFGMKSVDVWLKHIDNVFCIADVLKIILEKNIHVRQCFRNFAKNLF